MDSQLKNYHKFQSDMKFLKNRECSNVDILCDQNVQSSLTAHAYKKPIQPVIHLSPSGVVYFTNWT